MIRLHYKDVELKATLLEVSENKCNNYTKTYRIDLKLIQTRKRVGLNLL